MADLLSSTDALIATFATLVFFAVATVLIGRRGLIKKYDHDSYMAARNTQGALSLSLSFFVSGAGAWVFFTVPEAALLGGPVALVGYILSCIIPLLIFRMTAPYLRTVLPKGITYFEFIQERYGPLVNFYATGISFFYMFLYLTAEFTSVGSCVTILSNLSSSTAPIVGTSIVTLLYTVLGGLPVSLITDRVQAAGVVLFTFIVCIAAFDKYSLPSNEEADADAAIWDRWRTVTKYGTGTLYDAGENYEHGFKMAVVLIIAVTSAQLMHSGFQQRIWAAADSDAIKKGLVGGVLITIPFMVLFGVLGFLAFANFGYTLFGPPYVAFLSMFFLVQGLNKGWQLLSIILAVMMVASSADTLQSGVSGLLSPCIDSVLEKLGGVKPGSSPKLSVALNFFLSVFAVNVPAICLACEGISVLSLFVMADLLCATCICPILMGLSPRIHPHAALAGCLVGFTTAFAVYGAGIDSEDGDLKMMTRAGGLYSDTALTAFLLTPTASTVATLLVNIPFAMQGYRFAGFKATGVTVKTAEGDAADKTTGFA